MQWFFLLIVFCYQIAENIVEISRTTGKLVDPVYNIKAIRGMLTEMKNNPGRFRGKRILCIHTGTIFHHCLPPSDVVFNLCFLSLIKSCQMLRKTQNFCLLAVLESKGLQ